MGADNYGAHSGAIEEEEVGEEQQPFLKKDRDNTDETSINVPPSGFTYNTGNRPYRDVGFSIAFAIFVTASLGIGIFAALNQNPDYQWIESASYDHRQGCEVPEGNGANSFSLGSERASRGFVNMRGLLSLDEQSGGMGRSVKVALYVLGVTFILGGPFGFFLLWVLRTFTKELVYITLPIFFISQVALNVAWFVSCSNSESCKDLFNPTLRYVIFGGVFVLNLLFLWILYRNWDRIQLSIRVIRTASEALHKNLGLLLVLPGLDLVYCLYLIPAGLFLFFAYTNGKIITNPELVQDPELVCGGRSNRPCCVWETDTWVPAYLTLTTFSILWAALVVTEIHVFTVSGTISQWYFAVAGSSTVGTTKRSLRHAVGPSLGTLCFSGLIVTIVRTIRSAMESSRSNRGEVGCVALLVRACLECLLSAVEFLTKFTTNFAAITGEGLCQSAVMTFDLLKRNLLSTVVVETVAGRLLGQAIFVFAAVYGLLVWGVLALFVHNGKHLWSVAIGASVVLLLFLVYFVQLLHHVVDTVYICYAMDKDHDEVSKPDVHNVFVLLPAADDNTASLAVPKSSRKN